MHNAGSPGVAGGYFNARMFDKVLADIFVQVLLLRQNGRTAGIIYFELLTVTWHMQGNLFASGCLVHELPDSPSLLSRRIKAAGYTAGYTGKWHLGYGKQAYEDPHFQQYIPKIDACLRAVTFPEPYCEASSQPSDLGYEGDDFPGHGGSGLYYPQMIEYLKQRNLQFKVDNKGGYGPVIFPAGIND